MQKKRNDKINRKSGLYFGILVVVLAPFFYFSSGNIFSVSYQSEEFKNNTEINLPEAAKEDDQKVFHLPTPASVKGVYMTSCVVGTQSLRENLVRLVEETELNSIIIDIKDYTGTLSFKPLNPDLIHAWDSARCGTLDMKSFIEDLHQKGIYVIGRITVFQDPHMANKRPDLAVLKASDGSVWKDFKGLSFTNPTQKEIWDYHIAIAKDSYELGFDELNFDYIRFPSDGPMKDIHFPGMGTRSKPEVIEDFFSYLHAELKNTGIVMSADLFGMTTTNTDDLNIGQVWERALPYFDFVMPMVYPSHYPKNFNGWPNPNTVPYELIKFVMDSAVRRTVAPTTSVETKSGQPIYNNVLEFDPAQNATTTKKVFSGLYEKQSYDKNKARPWIQDFNYGGTYGPVEVQAQIQATYDAGLNSWIVWDPANKYESLRQVLLHSNN